MTLRQDLHIRQGETWSYVFTKRDAAGAAVDLTGYSARAAIKTGIRGLIGAYLSTGADGVGGAIALGGATGTVTLSMTSAQSAALGDICGLETFRRAYRDLISWTGPWWHRRMVARFIYDLELVSPGGVVTRELEGPVHVRLEVTA